MSPVMTKERLKQISDLEDKIRDTEHYLNDLKNERNKLILYSAIQCIKEDEAEKITKGETL